MKRSALLIALASAAVSGCAAMAITRGPDPRIQLQQGVAALQAQQYPQARGFLEPLYVERWAEPVGQRATLALIAAELDARNPERRLWAAADIASRLLNVETLEPWMVPITETFYLMSLEMGAQEERLARADSARVQAEQRAAQAENRAGRRLPNSPVESVPSRIRQIAAERDAQKRRADQFETQLTAAQKELRDTKAELERIKKIIKP